MHLPFKHTDWPGDDSRAQHRFRQAKQWTLRGDPVTGGRLLAEAIGYRDRADEQRRTIAAEAHRNGPEALDILAMLIADIE